MAPDAKEKTMLKKRKVLSLAAATLSLALVASACSKSDSGSSPSPGGSDLSSVTGSINISGSSTVQPITSLVAEQFKALAPNVSTAVDGPGTGDGFVLFCQGKTDISDASRQIKDDEAAECAKAGIHYVELEIGLDGITVMTNPANDAVTCLNDGDLYALFGPESEGFSKWSDANSLATTVGGTGNFADVPLDISAPGQESGTYDAFIELSGIPDIAASQGVPEDKQSTLRNDYPSSPSDNVIIQAMAGSDSSLGFVGFAFADQNADSVKEIQVDGGDGCVAPSKDTIADGTYPLSRSLYIYVNTDKAGTSPALKAFVDYYMSAEGIASVSAADYVDLPAERIAATQATWQGAEG
jgi:phosphate transport system substrate-binding protein